jgi:hypothetical protein
VVLHSRLPAVVVEVARFGSAGTLLKDQGCRKPVCQPARIYSHAFRPAFEGAIHQVIDDWQLKGHDSTIGENNYKFAM